MGMAVRIAVGVAGGALLSESVEVAVAAASRTPFSSFLGIAGIFVLIIGTMASDYMDLRD